MPAAQPGQHFRRIRAPLFPHLITGGDDFTVQVWNVETGESIRALAGATQLIVDSGELIRVFGGNRWTVDSVAFDS